MPGSTQENPSWNAAEAGQLIEKLPGIQACRVLPEDGIPTEIHILADDTRSPKQIARDVQSALMARYGLYVDHRVISIAQIPSAFAVEKNAPAAPSRLICERLSLSMNKREFEATVQLSLGEQLYQGTDEGRMAERQQVIGRAAVTAINQFLKDQTTVRLNATGETMLDGRRVILASVAWEGHGDAEQLVGAAFDKEDADITVVYAVLDAINRRIRF